MVTVEAALVLPSLLVLATCASWGVTAAWAQLRCAAAAAAGVVAAGSGASPATIAAVTRADAPAGAVVSVRSAGALMTVSVSFSAQPLGGLLSALPQIDVRASDTAYRSPIAPAPPLASPAA